MMNTTEPRPHPDSPTDSLASRSRATASEDVPRWLIVLGSSGFVLDLRELAPIAPPENGDNPNPQPETARGREKPETSDKGKGNR